MREELKVLLSKEKDPERGGWILEMEKRRTTDIPCVQEDGSDRVMVSFSDGV